MITHKDIKTKVESPELNAVERDVLNSFDKICSEKIEGQFAGTDRVYIGDVLFSDIFRNKQIASKRQTVILAHLKEKAGESGWNIDKDEDYYVLTPKK